MYLPFEPSKLTEEVKTHVPDATKLLASRKATALGMSLSEYLRDLICMDNHGAPYDELLMTHRRKLRAGAQGQPEAQAMDDHGQVQAATRAGS